MRELWSTYTRHRSSAVQAAPQPLARPHASRNSIMNEFGTLLPKLVSPPPGPQSQKWVERLGRVECPAITHRRDLRRQAGAQDPIVWARAQGANIEDADGNIFVDLSGGFAVASVGHAHPRVVEAAQKQAASLLHAMGDLFPSREKVMLSEALARVAPEGLNRSILGIGGSDAVEAAIKTALIATGKRRVLAFSGGYHGMSLGALGVSGYRDSFREPFVGQAGHSDLRLPFPGQPRSPFEDDDGTRCLDYIDWMLGSDTSGSASVAAIIVEPIQGRGGVVVPPAGFLRGLREITTRRGVVLIFDEIYTGFGRTGAWFACQHEGVTPDIMAVGKSLAGGAPIGACLATEAVMEGWGRPHGEAIHTSTFLGNPLVCAMALAALQVLEDEDLIARSAREGAYALDYLRRELSDCPRVEEVRGQGMMIGIALLDREGAPWGGGGVQAMSDLIREGFVVSPGGAMGELISLAPPLTISRPQFDAGLEAIVRWCRALPHG